MTCLVLHELRYPYVPLVITIVYTFLCPVFHAVQDVDPNVLTGSLNDIISCDSVTMYDMIVEGELESPDGSTPEMKYGNLMKSGGVDDCIYPTDGDHDYTPPVKCLVGYVSMKSPISETVQ